MLASRDEARANLPVPARSSSLAQSRREEKPYFAERAALEGEIHLVWPGAHIADFRRADLAAVFPPLASGLNGGSGVSCALGSIEHIEPLLRPS